jgi:hypothetical protein
MIVTGKEKAIIGGLTAAATTLDVQLANSNNLTVKQVIYVVVAYILTHITVYATTNTTPKI